MWALRKLFPIGKLLANRRAGIARLIGELTLLEGNRAGANLLKFRINVYLHSFSSCLARHLLPHTHLVSCHAHLILRKPFRLVSNTPHLCISFLLWDVFYSRMQELAYAPRLECSLCVYKMLARLRAHYNLQSQIPDSQLC